MLKRAYFDAHHRHKWQCFRIRLVDKTTYTATFEQLMLLVALYQKSYRKNYRNYQDLDLIPTEHQQYHHQCLQSAPRCNSHCHVFQPYLIAIIPRTLINF